MVQNNPSSGQQAAAVCAVLSASVHLSNEGMSLRHKLIRSAGCKHAAKTCHRTRAFARRLLLAAHELLAGSKYLLAL